MERGFVLPSNLDGERGDEKWRTVMAMSSPCEAQRQWTSPSLLSTAALLKPRCERSRSFSLFGFDRRPRRPRLSATFRCSAFGGAGPHFMVEDNLDALLQVLPSDLRDDLMSEPGRSQLVEVILDLGRLPEARYQGEIGGKYLRRTEVTMKDLECALDAVEEFTGNNRAGMAGTLHRISAIKNREGAVVGLTCRVGRAVIGHGDMVYDLLRYGKSILFVGRPGVGKTTAMRDLARVLSDELCKRVVIVDTSNEIGGYGDVPHAAIGSARRLQVPEPLLQHKVMIEAVENHMPEVIIVDEISTKAEAFACQSIAERGVMLIGTAHGETLTDTLKNPILSDLVGGVRAVTLGDGEARLRRSRKIVRERKAPPTFPFVVEMRNRCSWVMHRVCTTAVQPLLAESVKQFFCFFQSMLRVTKGLFSLATQK